jgi:YHS domain-containing protein|tara:strand:+ start:512 stop:802 length:291 start_codon:yes stop_codon:yes gene_type:complete
VISIIEAIVAINPNAEVSVLDEDYNQITWIKGSPISEEDIRAKRAELQAEYDAKEYQRKRKAEYPSVRELVVALYDTDDKSAIETKRAEVKAKYPK